MFFILPQRRVEAAAAKSAPSLDEESLMRTTLPSEWVAPVLAGINLCFLPWAFGGVDGWAVKASAALAGATLMAALKPRRVRQRGSARVFRQSTWPRLVRFPIFWIGLIFLVYIGVQAVNPAFNYHSTQERWWLEKRAFWTGLPSGVQAPFDEMNPVRMFLYWATCWATSCALWIGVTKRRIARGLLTALVINAFVFACFGLIQRASGTSLVYWTRPVAFPYFFSALIYKNHAAAYLGLMAAVAGGLAADHFWRNRRHYDRSGAGIILLFIVFTLSLSIILTFSFAGIALAALVGALVAGVTLWRYSRLRTRRSPSFLAVTAVGLVIFFAGGFGARAGYADLKTKFQLLVAEDGRQSLHMRALAAEQGWAMFKDRWLWGWGAGCFRYGFTKYQRRAPDIAQWRGRELRWEHVHDDWLELLIEFGVAGSLCAFAGGVCWLRLLARRSPWNRAGGLPIFCGLAALCLYGFFDFPLQNLAVACTASALLPLVFHWTEPEPSADEEDFPRARKAVRII